MKVTEQRVEHERLPHIYNLWTARALEAQQQVREKIRLNEDSSPHPCPDSSPRSGQEFPWHPGSAVSPLCVHMPSYQG